MRPADNRIVITHGELHMLNESLPLGDCRNVVLITAKGSNSSIPNKNVIPILGTPVLLYGVRAAMNSLRTNAVFLSTEDKIISNLAEREGAHVIKRPTNLSQPTSQHKDVIEHGVKFIRDKCSKLQNVIVLLGNTVMTTAGLIDHAFGVLEDGSADSVISAWRAQDDHPYRALQLCEEGFVRSFLDLATGSNRQEYPPVYYYDQGVWGFKYQCALEQRGPKPWVWLGQRCKIIERPWVTGRDIHDWIDVSASAWYLTAIQAHDFQSYDHL